MTRTLRLAKGQGWRIHDVICTAGPSERPFEEQHQSVCVAMVLEGSFEYRSTTGSALLAPGALMLGNAGQYFECGHEHATGDRCLSFHFDAAFMEDVAAAVPGARRLDFSAPALPPMSTTAPLFAVSELALDEGDSEALEEIAARVAGGAVLANADPAGARTSPNARDSRRITAAVRRIEADSDAPLGLEKLAGDVAMSPYHFLRTFRALIGMTPHQFVLHTRLRRAASRLRRTRDGIAAIAFESGFGDLSTFNKQFRRVFGRTPSQFRRGA